MIMVLTVKQVHMMFNECKMSSQDDKDCNPNYINNVIGRQTHDSEIGV